MKKGAGPSENTKLEENGGVDLDKIEFAENVLFSERMNLQMVFQDVCGEGGILLCPD